MFLLLVWVVGRGRSVDFGSRFFSVFFWTFEVPPPLFPPGLWSALETDLNLWLILNVRMYAWIFFFEVPP